MTEMSMRAPSRKITVMGRRRVVLATCVCSLALVVWLAAAWQMVSGDGQILLGAVAPVFILIMGVAAVLGLYLTAPFGRHWHMLLHYTVMIAVIFVPLGASVITLMTTGDMPPAAELFWRSIGFGLLAIAAFCGGMCVRSTLHIHAAMQRRRWAAYRLLDAKKEAARITAESEVAETTRAEELAERRETALQQAIDDLAERITAREARKTNDETDTEVEDRQEREDLELLTVTSWDRKNEAEAEAEEWKGEAEMWREIAEELDRRLRRTKQRAAMARSGNRGDFWAGAAAASWLK
ncbi:MAG: hypothetical protein OXE84_07175 [Rhodobacteraceae bacterium]|nr:hypothetical protein [Paracoccaceae bacterium]